MLEKFKGEVLLVLKKIQIADGELI